MDDNQIADDRARRFATAPQAFEQDSDAFHSAVRHRRRDRGPGRPRGAQGGEVKQFWQEYRDQFTQISTTFHNVVESDDQFALEWTSNGTLRDDRPIDYRGVTVIDLDGDTITRLRTYYDSAAFVLVPAEST